MPSRVQQFTRNIKQRVLFRDFAISFGVESGSGELKMITNEHAVIQAIKNLVLIYPTEIPYHPLTGSVISRSLFEFIDEFQADLIRDTIINTIQNQEPRAQNVTCNVRANPQDHTVIVDVQFSMHASQTRINVPTIVLRVR